MNIKESGKIDNYFDLVRELKKLWSMKFMVLLIVVGALEIVPKGLVRRVEVWGLEKIQIKIK